MKELMRKLFNRTGKSKHAKTRAQSMVEFAVLLPLLLILFTGMVEFGFMLNTYLSILDSTRFAARKYSNSNPYIIDGNGDKIYNENFSTNVASAVVDSLSPDDPEARQIIIDPWRDDILVSVVSVQVIDDSTDPYTISITRHTTDPGPVDYYSFYKNGGVSKFTDDKISESMNLNGSQPVNAGLLIVEIYYSYEGVLQLPWVEMFASADNPVMLYSSTIMPLVAVRPDTYSTATP